MKKRPVKTTAEDKGRSDLYQKIENRLAQIDHVDRLKGLFYECHFRSREHADDWQDNACPYFLAETAIVFRAADIGNEAAAVFLVNLLRNPKLGLDGEQALNVSHAISMCGQKAIKHLKMLGGPSQQLAKDVIKAIQNGELYGP